MSHVQAPQWYQTVQQRHPKYMAAVEALGTIAREEGPIDSKTLHLIQLAAAAAIRSEGSVHSHVKRALAAGATPEEITHAILVLTSTIGFPTVAAAMSWAEDVLSAKE